MKKADDQKQADPTRAKRYSAPVLTEYGSIAKLTGKGGSFLEGASNKKNASCL
jgi:hypothetical protein